MTPRIQEKQHSNPHQDEQRHLLPLWIRWFIILFVLLVSAVGAVFWVLQGGWVIVPSLLFAVLGVLLTLFQLLPWLFPRDKYAHPANQSLQLASVDQHIPPASLAYHPPSTHAPTDSTAIIDAVQIPDDPSSPPLELVDKPTDKLARIPFNVDQSEAFDTEQFYGRENELAELKLWIEDDRCRVIAIVGTGGIGKTALSSKLTEQIQSAFDFTFWRSLQNAPPLKTTLHDCIQLVSSQQQTILPEDVDSQIALLIEYLRKRRCLIVLDNFESLLQAGSLTGHYREGYEGYGKLLRSTGEIKHQSCFLLTCREKPQEVALLEGDTSPVRSYQLNGLESADGRKILKDKGLHGTRKAWNALIDCYGGNPLALKLVSQFIQEVFNGDVSGFLKSGDVIFSDIRDVLDQQVNRLSPLEQEILYWLAIERAAISQDKIQRNSANPISKRALQEALRSLRRRNIIQTSVRGLSLQNVIMEYMTDRFIDQVCLEIRTGKLNLFGSYALIQAQAIDFIRESQIRLILMPLAQQLLFDPGKEGIEEKFKSIISMLRETHSQRPSYIAGNILNLLVQLGYDLRNYDFSHLLVRQAYLSNVVLAGVNFRYASFEQVAFTDTFGAILSVAFSPNGELLAAGTANGEIRLWQVSGSTPLLACRGHTDSVYSVTFSPDGHILASGSGDHTVRLWEVNTGHCLNVLQGHTNHIRSITFSNDSRLLASGGEDQTVWLWEVDTGHCLNVLQGHADGVWSVAFSSDNRLLASGSGDHSVRFWEVNTGHCHNILQEHTDGVWSVAFSPDGQLLASGSEDQTVRLWEVNTGHCLNVLQGHTNRIRSVAFSPDGNLLASSGNDQTIRLWKVSTGHCLKALVEHTNWVRSVAFSPDGRLLASSGNDQTIRLWKVSTGHCLKVLQGYANRIRSVAFSPDGRLLASGSEDKILRIWEVNTGSCLISRRGHTNGIWSVAFSPDMDLLASGSDDYTVRFWKIGTDQYLKTVQEHTGRVRSVVFSPNGNLLASGSNDQSVRIWEVSTGYCLKILAGHTHWVRSVVFSPNGNLLASGSRDRTVRLWEVNTARCLNILQEHTDGVWSVAFSPDGQLLASGSEDQTVRLWEVNTGHCLKTLQGHASRIRSVAFSPDGSLLASGSEDQTVCIWKISTGQQIKTLQGHSGQVWSVSFSPDGQILATGSNDGSIKLWDIHTEACLKTLRSERPYEQMNITGVIGLTEAQEASLKALGAFEEEEHMLA